MSFGDIARLPRATGTPTMELQGTLNAFAANNAALRRTSHQLRSADPTEHPPLNRVRELREQNRDIARAAATLAARIDRPEMRAEFQGLVQQFSDALRENVAAEREALQMAAGERGEGEVAVAEEGERERLLGRGVGERVYTGGEVAVWREIEGNEQLVRERNMVLEEIRSSVDDVNAIFKDLAVMVGDQRADVEYVEVAVGEAGENVRRGRVELERTQRRREARKRVFFCMLLGFAVGIAVLLIILLS